MITNRCLKYSVAFVKISFMVQVYFTIKERFIKCNILLLFSNQVHNMKKKHQETYKLQIYIFYTLFKILQSFCSFKNYSQGISVTFN